MARMLPGYDDYVLTIATQGHLPSAGSDSPTIAGLSYLRGASISPTQRRAQFDLSISTCSLQSARLIGVITKYEPVWGRNFCREFSYGTYPSTLVLLCSHPTARVSCGLSCYIVMVITEAQVGLDYAHRTVGATSTNNASGTAVMT